MRRAAGPVPSMQKRLYGESEIVLLRVISCAIMWPEAGLLSEDDICVDEGERSDVN